MNYIELLKEHGLKVTPQRLCILESLYKKGHLNIDQLYNILKSDFPTISLATIYKNMNSMSAISLVEEVKIPDAKSVYEIKKKEHSHLVCSSCNEIVDIELDTKELIKDAESASDFKLKKSSIVLNGVCPNCVA